MMKLTKHLDQQATRRDAANRAKEIRNRMNDIASIHEEQYQERGDELPAALQSDYEDIEIQLEQLQDRWGLDI
ncbi:MAG: hypothetical protein U9Q07_02320 [Planctomycetota bacterium]|nr:hypothetical protein [Planctomycetota bacterium]